MNNQIKTIDIVVDGNKKVEADVIAIFSVPENMTNYVVYTMNEIDENGEQKVYVSKLVEQHENYGIVPINDEEELNRVRENIQKILEAKNE